jgi:hypothetical protein
MLINDIPKGLLFKSNHCEWVVNELVACRNRITGQWSIFVRCTESTVGPPELFGQEAFDIPLEDFTKIIEAHNDKEKGKTEADPKA